MPSLRNLPAALALAGPFITSAVLASPLTTTTNPHTGNRDDDYETPLPLVIWHGLGDDYTGEGLQAVGALAEAAHPGIFVYYVRLDSGATADRTATFYGNVTEQLAQVCAELAAHPILSTAPAVDALGFSQGGQFLRGYVERCNAPPVRSLLTVGSQHNGIVDYRACGSADWLCRGAMALLHGQTWSSFVQSRLVPAQYFRDPADLDSYLQHSNFLADINNERPDARNETYADNVARLANFVMHMFEDDTTVVPRQTSWFQEVERDGDGDGDSDGGDQGVGSKVTPLRERPIYTEDWIGLRRLDEKGGLRFVSSPGNHMELSDDLLTDLFTTYLGPAGKKFPKEGESEGPGEL